MEQVIGAGLNVFGNALSSSVGAVAGGWEAEKNRQHDKYMATLNQQYNMQSMAKAQEYNLATMAQQNQYQIDQWNRENEYNDPSAVAQRYRDAGINPRAAFGQGSAGGAGISGGLSSAPSGGSPSGSGPMGSAHPQNPVSQALSRLDIGGALSTGVTAFTNAKKTQAETEAQLIENKYKENEILLKLEKERKEILNTEADTAEKRKHIEELDQRIAESKATIKEINQNIRESSQRIKKSEKETELIEQNAERARLENAFYKKFGAFPNQHWITAAYTHAIHLGEKGFDKIQEAFDNIDPKLKDFGSSDSYKKQGQIIHFIIDKTAEGKISPASLSLIAFRQWLANRRKNKK